MGYLLSRLFVGAFAGFFAWMIMEPSAPAVDTLAWSRWEGQLILLFCLFVGGAVGGYNGWARGGKVHLLRGLGLGAVLGAIGGTLGMSVGGAISAMFFGGAIFLNGALPIQMAARAMAFVPLGAGLGLAIGGADLNPRKAVQGMIGGALGALLAGLAFDPISLALGDAMLRARGQLQGEVGGPARGVSFTLIGGMISLFIGLVERLLRSAWLRLELGRNEYKEWSVDLAQTAIGAREGNPIPLFGDPNVAPVHALLIKHGPDRYSIADQGSPIGTGLNGQRIQHAALVHGDVIQIAGFQLRFMMKNQAAPVRLQDGRPVGMPPQAMPPHAIPPSPAPAPAPVAMNPTVAMPAGAIPPVTGWVLVAMDGPNAGARFPLPGPVLLGRESPHVPMAYDAQASRRHAEVVPEVGGLAVRDLGSTNGTFVNGQPVQNAVLPPGSMLRVGSSTFRVEPA